MFIFTDRYTNRRWVKHARCCTSHRWHVCINKFIDFTKV